MATTTLTRSAGWGRLRPWLLSGGTLVILALVAYWGGAAKIDARFWTGVLVLSGLILAFAGVTWWLFLSPVPARKKARLQSPPAIVRQTVGLMAIVSGLLFVAGGTWDEVWHRLYGVGGAVNDFFWAPHKMLYGSMALTALFAVGGLLLMLRGRGDIRLRFRAEPLLGLLALASAYLAFSGPSDALWHIVYGLDITAWSLPHIIITSGAALVMLTTAAIQLAQLPAAPWRGLGGLRLQEGLAALMMAAGMVVFTQAAATEWEGIQSLGADRRLVDAFWARPEWLYPVVVLSVIAFFGHVALHATRRAGFATLVAVVALALRYLLLSLSGLWAAGEPLPLKTHLFYLLPALALDAWYWLRRRDAESATTLVGGALASAAFGLLTVLPLVAAWMVYPRVNAATMPGMVVFGALMTLWFGWVGAGFGGWLGQLGGHTETATALSPRALWVGAGTLVVLALVTVVLMLTATPPTV